MPIRRLPSSLVLKIAAGEMIERPASIVKELIENSLDAGASRVEIRLGDGGRESISVTDDGSGISAEDVPMALQRHTTSKIDSAEDLFNIKSFGFRGEALASIAAVSMLDLMTRTVGSASGTHLRAVGGEIRLVEPEGTPPGTTIAVSELFYNFPARKKFLRSKSTEFNHIETVVRRAALSEIGKEFLLEHEEELITHLPPAKALLDRLRQLYGLDVTEKLVFVEGGEKNTHVQGYISNSHLSFKRPDEISIFVNHRPIRDRMLQAAVMEGFRTALMERRYPFAVVYIDLPRSEVDVNVHPTKAEVRFQDTQTMFKMISDSIATSLRRKPASFVSRTEEHKPSSPVPYDLTRVTIEPSVARTAPFPYFETSSLGVFASLELLGNLDHTYLIGRNQDSIYLIDQHAAHERVKFERLKKMYEAAQVEHQQLLFPLTLEISEKHQRVMGEMIPFLASVGFELEPFGGRTIVIKAIPAVLDQHDPRPLLFDLLSEEGGTSTAFKDRIDDILSRIACHSAVRAHDPLGDIEMRSLLSQMDQTDLATNCPHGRPTFLRFTLGDLERLFGRK